MSWIPNGCASVSQNSTYLHLISNEKKLFSLMLQNWLESAGNKVLLLFFAFTPNQWSEKSQENSIFFLQEKS